MDKVWAVIFTLSVLFIAHSYLVYPLLMTTLFSKKRSTHRHYGREEELPAVAVLVAAFNEEKVIGEKIVSVFQTNYPLHKLKVYVGSDASLDGTDKIVDDLRQTYPNLELVRFEGRVGKISIINHLQSLGDEEILVMTDANVIFKPDTLYELVKYFKDDRVGIVAANIVKESAGNEGISYQEKQYMSFENHIKAAESNAYNLIMGAEGGCYAIRNNLFSKVPGRFIVDDFYITMQVLLKGRHTLFNPECLCSEDVSGSTAGEYRRKVRISSGNFQNLFFFRHILVRFWKPMGFAFWSHKVLRWLTPFFLLAALVASAMLLHHVLFKVLFALQVVGLVFPLLQYLFGFQSRLLKFIGHFYLMNFALFEGFLKFTRGIESSIWQPVKRNV